MPHLLSAAAPLLALFFPGRLCMICSSAPPSSVPFFLRGEGEGQAVDAVPVARAPPQDARAVGEDVALVAPARRAAHLHLD